MFACIFNASILNVSGQSNQSQKAISEMRKVIPAPIASPKLTLAASNARNELQALSTGLFFVYKRFISSQDRPSCGFYPSCSEYALLSVRKNGLIIGGLAALDRLMRCNGENSKWYDTHAGRLYDMP